MAALRWFLGVVSTQIVGQMSGGKCSEEEALDSKKVRTVCGDGSGGFQMPLHYPRYKKEDYERMEEWRVDMLLMQYGLTYDGSVEEKREFTMGTFLWA